MTKHTKALHIHDWRVLDLCRDICDCGRVMKVCPPRHDHRLSVFDGRRFLLGKDYYRRARS